MWKQDFDFGTAEKTIDAGYRCFENIGSAAHCSLDSHCGEEEILGLS
jgi:hypothetical protein